MYGRTMYTVSVTLHSVLLLRLLPLPSFCQRRVAYSIEEERPVGTVLGNIPIESGLAGKYSPAVLASLRYKFRSRTTSNSELDVFSITDTGGILKIAKRIDRDQICIQKRVCILRADVAVRPLQYYAVIQVEVTILDINDNWPKFPTKNLRLEISESSPVGLVSVIPEAKDRDSATNGVKEYVLVASSSQFRLNVLNEGDGGELQLMQDSELDRETKDKYSLKIVARDGGSPPKSGSLVIDVIVTDANDNVPKFTNKTYEIRVFENVTLNSKLLVVKATDLDSGLNGKIQYSFGRMFEYRNTFAIDSTSGEIYLKQKLKYATNKKYVFRVSARDMGSGSAMVRALVKIHVLDVNDHAPKIVLNDLSTEDHLQVQENNAVGTAVSLLLVEDLDGGENGKFTCTMNDRYFTLQHVYDNEYKLATTAVFDRETKSNYRVTVSCHDFGRPRLTSTTNLNVNIKDLNDNSPVFDRDAYRVSLQENNKVSASVMRINCTDRDAGANGELMYSLDRASTGQLGIEPRTGLLTALVVFDRERASEIRTTVLVRDKGDPARSASATIILSIKDVNDEKPRFSQDKYVYYVLEKVPPGQEVGTVHVYDADTEPFSKSRFTIEGSADSPDSGDFFTVGKYSGKITSTTMLLKQTNLMLKFVVFATNTEPPWHSSYTNVTVFVVDKSEMTAIAGHLVLSDNMLVIFILSGGLLLMVIALIVIVVVCLRRRRKARMAQRNVTENLLQIAHREADIIRANGTIGANEKEWHKLDSFINPANPPRYTTVDKTSSHWGENDHLESTTSDQDTTEYENEGSGYDSVPRSVSSRKDSAPRSHKEASLPRANPPAPKPSVAPRSNPRPIQLPYMQGRPV